MKTITRYTEVDWGFVFEKGHYNGIIYDGNQATTGSTTKQVARRLHVSLNGLNHWRAYFGIEVEKNARGRMIYSRENVELLETIISHKKKGKSLFNIRELLNQAA